MSETWGTVYQLERDKALGNDPETLRRENERLRFENEDMRRTFGSHPLIKERDDKIELLRAALTLIAAFKGRTLFSYTRGDDGDSAYREGANAAFEQAADIAQSALATP